MGDKPTIGWIGLGKMGAPMAQNLMQAGFQVTVYNRTPEKAKPLTDAGAALAGSLAELAAGCDVVISMINDDAALEAVAMAPDGVLANAKAGGIYVDMSTVSPAASARVAETAAGKGISYLRAPVSGSTVFAESAQLIILVSGPKEAAATCDAAFAAMGKKTMNFGEGEEARFMKLTVNMMVSITAGLVGEALAFGESGGLDWQQMLEMIGQSPLASPLLGYKTQTLKNRDYAPAFTIDQIAKDLDLILSTGQGTNASMPLASLVRQNYETMREKGEGNLDMFAYVTLMEELAGIKPGE